MNGERKMRELVAVGQKCRNWDRKQGFCKMGLAGTCACLIAAREHLKLAKPVRRVERKP